MTIYACILGDAPVPLWGLSSRERLHRMLGRAGVTGMVEDIGAVPSGGALLLLRGDYLYDGRVLTNLVKSAHVVLRVGVAEKEEIVGVHVPAALGSAAKAVVESQHPVETLDGVRLVTPEMLASTFDESLLKSDPPTVERITQERQAQLEAKLFSGSYKGVTDLVTKWVWPRPAKWITRQCVGLGVTPNQVTVLSLVLAIAAGALFAFGHFGWGLLAGWVMTFLDTVDGKLARVTVTSSRFGHVLDKNLDLIHPPLWYIAWGVGLEEFQPGPAGVSFTLVLWLIVMGYIGGRLVEGVFLLWLGKFGIFCWRPLDSYVRLITARRNPNLILLTAGLAAGRPDLGLVAVALWTVLSSLLLVVRIAQALYARWVGGPLRSWMADVGAESGPPSMAVRLFTHHTAEESLGRGQ